MKNINVIRICRFFMYGFLISNLSSCHKEESIKEAAPINFNPLIEYGEVTDIEGNVYKTVAIDTQIWMAENLKTTKYSDGSRIPLITDNTEWSQNGFGYCWYENNPEKYKNTYGALYKWYTVNSEKICPVGWHVPADAEWLALINFTGSEAYAGRNLKEAGTTHWICPEYGGDNPYGFTALPGGWRTQSGEFGFLDIDGIFWTSSEKEHNYAYDRVIYSCYEDIYPDWAHVNTGFSVRCVKD